MPINENRESFFNRISSMPLEDRLMVQTAYILAKGCFHTMYRKQLGADGKPIRYFEHLRGTNLILIDELGIKEPNMICAGFLHDGIEDTHDLTEILIKTIFNSEVSDMVKMVSKIKGESPDKYLKKLREDATCKQLILKGCDKLNNMRTLDGCSPDFQIKQLTEVKSEYYSIFDRMVNIAPTEYLVASKTLRDKIHEVVEHEKWKELF